MPQNFVPFLSENARTEMIGVLNDRLADTIDLSHAVKQAHWNLKGTGFIGVHELLDDVAPAIRAWDKSGIDVRIYSSGSIAAQKLFFGHTVAGNLLGCLRGHYDTTTGAKKEPSSYEKISNEFGIPASEIVFVSDIVDELKAASSAGMQTVLSDRPGNKAVEDGHGFKVVSSFAEILQQRELS